MMIVILDCTLDRTEFCYCGRPAVFHCLAIPDDDVEVWDVCAEHILEVVAEGLGLETGIPLPSQFEVGA